jgi:hypothetical protein
MRGIRIIGLLLIVYGVGMFALLYTPWKDWALDHSIASAVAVSDRRVGNEVSTTVDMPIAIAGSAVVTFAGLWMLVLVPWVMNRYRAQMEAGYAEAVARLDQEDEHP